MLDDLKEYAETVYTDRDFAEKCGKYTYARPFTKESLLYREIFEKYYPGQAEMIVDYWMPTRHGPTAMSTTPAPACWQTTAQAGNKGKAAELPAIADARPPPLMGRLSRGRSPRKKAPHQGSWPSLRGLRGTAR